MDSKDRKIIDLEEENRKLNKQLNDLTEYLNNTREQGLYEENQLKEIESFYDEMAEQIEASRAEYERTVSATDRALKEREDALDDKEKAYKKKIKEFKKAQDKYSEKVKAEANRIYNRKCKTLKKIAIGLGTGCVVLTTILILVIVL